MSLTLSHFSDNALLISWVETWGSNLPEFQPSHASDAFALCSGYLEGFGNIDGILPLTQDLAFLLWLDDLSDRDHAATTTLMLWLNLIEVLEGKRLPQTPPEKLLHGFSNDMAAHAASEADHRLWVSTLINTILSWQLEAHLSAGDVTLSFMEYLAQGEASSAIPHLMATVSLLYHLEMPQQMQRPLFRQLLRHFAWLARLENDLVSADKERREGCKANAVLLLERHLSASATAIVQAEKEGIERLFLEDCQRIGQTHPLIVLAQSMHHAHGRWYDKQAKRYDVN